MSAADYVESQYIRSESDEDGSEAEKIPMISSGGGKRPKFLSTHATTSWKLWVAVAVIILLLTANATLLSLWLWLPRDLDSTCINHTSAFWSPVMDDVRLTYRPTRFEGNPFVQSPYMRDAGPEVDQTWKELGVGYQYANIVPEERGVEAGLDPSSIKVNASLGGGYITSPRVIHQLHCLNMIRQTLPWNVDYYRSRKAGPWKKVDWVVRAHIDHCMDMVRQVIQCDSDVSMLAARWVVQEDQPVNYIPEFSSTHMCRNYDDVLEWVASHERDQALTPAIRDGDVVLTHPEDVER